MIETYISQQQISLTKLTERLHAADYDVIANKLISANFLYLINAQDTIDHTGLMQILQADAFTSRPRHMLIVTPRAATISPWSSKATEIINHCNVGTIERIELAKVFQFSDLPELHHGWLECFYDRMTEVVADSADFMELFQHATPQTFQSVDILQQGKAALVKANAELGLALSAVEIDYLYQQYQSLQRDPSDVELMMFAQVNSEHCRHKIFRSQWQGQEKSLFDHIKATYHHHREGILSAYHDNAALLQGYTDENLLINENNHYVTAKHELAISIKVETHNHPTLIAPEPGAATGSGGEIRDEAATGRGGKSLAGLCGFAVGNLMIPDWQHDWETSSGRAPQHASSLTIMLQGPIGAARFNNEFGRPNLCGFFRTLEEPINHDGTQWLSFCKPIMIAGGTGQVKVSNCHKQKFSENALIIVLGGPGMAIGLGGGAQSSQSAGEASVELDFASVQRSNPEMQRRAQEVIDRCCHLADNPILSIHDVGAGGVSNAIPEILADCGLGGVMECRDIHVGESGMAPLVIWCNESQERYVLAIDAKHLTQFTQIAQRENCPFSVVGHATREPQLTVKDRDFDNYPIDLPFSFLFEDLPLKQRQFTTYHNNFEPEIIDINLKDAVYRVLQCPSVASKSFLITIGDRTVGGLTARDQMVGPWQVPVADVAVVTNTLQSQHGQAMAMGERSPIAKLAADRSVRMAIAESILNCLAADVHQLSDIKLSANWMAAANDLQQESALYAAVVATSEFCQQLKITIPVGKDSLSMRCQWQTETQKLTHHAPVSLIVSAFSPVADCTRTLTPECQHQVGAKLWFIDLARGQQRLGATALAQVTQKYKGEPADANAEDLITFFALIKQLRDANLILAYHDRSDGGLMTTLCEMAFATRAGLTIDVSALGHDLLASLFNEELGVVVQLDPRATEIMAASPLAKHCYQLGELNKSDSLELIHGQKNIFTATRAELQQAWAETSYRLQTLRDNAVCADEEFKSIHDETYGLNVALSFNPDKRINFNTNAKPKVAILREQGTNGHYEMAAAFLSAEFDAIDVHMNDLLQGPQNLANFHGLAACGGFSYGDVLGAGRGWANRILHHDKLRQQFSDFFEDKTRFALGICNGCQMFAELRDIIPGTAHWPTFQTNRSLQYEARLSLIKVNDSPSIFFKEMSDSIIPIVVAHGEGRATWTTDFTPASAQVCCQYVNRHGEPSQQYPMNPNGSEQAVASVCNDDGRITIMMPHPERLFRLSQFSWFPDLGCKHSPWLKLFDNARSFTEATAK